MIAAVAIAALVCLQDFSAPSARADTFEEYQVKLVFLLNFTKLVDWPASAFPAADTPICIGVLGDDPFGSVLDKIVENKIVQHRKLTVKRSKNVQDLKDCHLMFISSSEKARTQEILTSLGGSPILTVGETEDFTRRGGIFNFYMDDNKVRFEINLDAANRRGLKIAPQLLKLGKIVSP